MTKKVLRISVEERAEHLRSEIRPCTSTTKSCFRDPKKDAVTKNGSAGNGGAANLVVSSEASRAVQMRELVCQPAYQQIPYFTSRNPRNPLGNTELSSCHVSTLHRVRSSTGRTQRITACQASSRSGRRASSITQTAKPLACAANTCRIN